MNQGVRLSFDGGAGSFLLAVILALVITVVTFGLGYPWALCILQKWRIEHTLLNNKRMRFHGTGLGVIGLWIKFWFLCIITLGIYGFWVNPQLQKWVAENTGVEL